MRVAIVGHDPSLPQAGLGKEIDSYDKVVKMNNCGWHWKEAYGARYDYGVTTKASLNLDYNVFPEKNKMWTYNKHGDKKEPCPHFNITPYISKYIVEVMFRLAGERVKNGISRGCAGILGAITVLNAKEVKLFGMSQIATGIYTTNQHPPEYFKLLSKEAQKVVPKELSHQWHLEHQIVHICAEENKCKITSN